MVKYFITVFSLISLLSLITIPLSAKDSLPTTSTNQFVKLATKDQQKISEINKLNSALPQAIRCTRSKAIKTS